MLSLLPKRTTPTNEILLIGTDQGLYRNGFQSQPLCRQFERYLEDRAAFIAALPAKLHSRLTVRLFDRDQGWRQKDRTKDAFPHIRVEGNEVPLTERLRSCALAVFDHPATSMLEALAMGTPTILFWDPAHWPMRASAGPFLQVLRAAGVIHDKPAAAANAVGLRADDPQSWWNAPATLQATAAINERFCYRTPAWKRRWTALL